MALRSRSLALTVADLRERARRRIPAAVFDFVDGGADAEATLRENEQAWGALRFVPRALTDVGQRDLSVTVLGQRLALPVVMGPAGMARVIAPHDGERAIARAAAASGSVYVLSTGSSVSLEEVAAAAPGAVWFQLYLWRDRATSEQLVARAAAAGYRVLVLTIDTQVRGQREREIRRGFTYPPRLTQGALRPRWAWELLRSSPIGFANIANATGDRRQPGGRYVESTMAPAGQTATWEDVDWLRRRWTGPLVVKGICTPQDAQTAVDHGADAILVSNHGGRQLDCLPGTASLLGPIVDKVGGHAEVLVDGGVRRGSDVAKALALGARAAVVVRPYLYGLGADGEAGVVRMLEILRTELDRCLALVGVRAAADLDATCLAGV